jgi:hypothetical protein
MPARKSPIALAQRRVEDGLTEKLPGIINAAGALEPFPTWNVLARPIARGFVLPATQLVPVADGMVETSDVPTVIPFRV